MRRRGAKQTRRTLETGLRSSATTAERIDALLSLGLNPRELAQGLGVRSASTLRNWTSAGSEPRPGTAIALDDLRLTAQVLLDGGLPPERVGNWLTSRNAEWLEGARPIDCVATTPMRVLSAAQSTVIEMMGGDEGGLPRLRLAADPARPAPDR